MGKWRAESLLRKASVETKAYMWLPHKQYSKRVYEYKIWFCVNVYLLALVLLLLLVLALVLSW